MDLVFGNSAEFSRISPSEKSKVVEIEAFLKSSGLEIDAGIEEFVTARQGDELIACGGLAGNIIKCVAIKEADRGKGLALKLVTELINIAYERSRSHLFIYSKTENEALFQQCGFYTIAKVPDKVVLMENSSFHLKNYLKELQSYRKPGSKIGCIVMNANPFTLGHRYLVEQSSAQCDWLHLFLVKEKSAHFPYEDRLRLVQEGTRNISNLTIHQGSDYIVSRATFPAYFLKDKGIVDACHTEIDLRIFRQHIAPALGITHRFVGTEPFCPVTAKYNKDMKYWLETPELPYPPVVLAEIERLSFKNMPISASNVRRLMENKEMGGIAEIVPETTFSYLQKLIQKN